MALAFSLKELALMQAFSCPCCGHYIGQAAPIEDVALAMPTGHTNTIFNVLAKHAGNLVSSKALIDALYVDQSDGGPLFVSAIISKNIRRCRQIIEPYGWTITHSKAGRGRVAAYRLIPLECGA